MKTLEDER